MKKTLFLWIFLSVISCVKINPEIKAQFEGQRILRKMATTSQIGSYVHSAFFLFGGSSSAGSYEDVKVWFSWQMNNGDFQNSSVPLEKVRISINEKADIPKVEFIFEEGCVYTVDEGIDASFFGVQRFLDSHLVYLRVIVKESDWQPDIRLPFNQEKSEP